MMSNVNEINTSGQFIKLIPFQTKTILINNVPTLLYAFADIHTGQVMYLPDTQPQPLITLVPGPSPVDTPTQEIHISDGVEKAVTSDVQPERVSPLMFRPVPNAHLDKELLTREELQQVLAWALERSTDEDFFNKNLSQIHIDGKPNDAATKLVDFLGTIVYGPNNYIGPGKTGNAIGNLEEIVTTVPALSVEDAAARAHDIALTVDPAINVDDILPPLARAAQIARPLFLGTAARRGRNTRYRHTNADQLSKDGDVEQNPGPIYKFTDQTSIDPSNEIVSDPVSYNTYLSDISQSSRVDDFAFWTHLGTHAHRNGADNQSDYVLHDNHFYNYVSMDASDCLPNPGSSPHQGMITMAIENKNPKEVLKDNALGLAMSSALNNLDTFTAMQRTATNTIHGDAMLGMYARSSKVDFGCYLPIAKMLAYEMLKAPLSGCPINAFKCDATIRADPTVASPPWEFLYPNSVGWNALTVTHAIEAYYMTPATAAAVLRGELLLPPDWAIDSKDVAFVVISPNLTPFASTYVTISHLEYPFVGGVDTTCQNVSFAAGGVVPNVIGGTGRTYLHNSIISGPKDKVMFVLSAAADTFFLQSNNILVPVAEWTVAAPPPTDILPVMLDWMNDNFRLTFATQTPEFSEALQYLLSFADMSDWKNAMYLASNLVNFLKFPTWPIDATAATSVPIVTNGTVAPTVDGQVAVRNLAALSQANRALLFLNYWGREPLMTVGGFWTSLSPSNPVPVAGGPDQPRAATPIAVLVQDSTWVTKWGIAVKFWKKEILSSNSVEKLAKARTKFLFYAMRKLGMVTAQMCHNFYQDRGVTNRMIHSVAPYVVDRRVQIFKRLAADISGWMKTWTGYAGIRMQIPAPFPAKAALPAALNGFYSETAWLDSPVYAYNHFFNSNDAKTYYDFQPDVNYTVDSSVKLPKFAPGAANNQAIFGINIGGNATVRLRYTSCTAGKDEINRRWTPEAKKAYAMTRVTSLLNPTPITANSQLFVIGDGSAQPLYYRSIYSFNWNFLRWSSTASDSQLYRASARGILAWTLPSYPPEMNVVNGEVLTLAGNNQNVLYGIRLSVNFSGIGSASFGMIQTSTGVDQDLTVTDDPF